jgi:hypothetical protein
MNLNINLLIIIGAVLVIIIFTLCFYYNIFTISHNPSNKYPSSAQWVGLYSSHSYLSGKGNFNLFNFFKLGLVGAVSRYAEEGPTTVINLTDEELFQLLEPILSEITGNVISLAYLHSLGLSSPTVVTFLENLGYIIT